MSVTLEQTLSALADPTRRHIVQKLAHGPCAAGELGAEFPISAPALSRHLRILREHGLVEDVRSASDQRVRMYQLRAAPLEGLRDWVTELTTFWQTQLDEFAEYVGRVES